MSMTNSARSYSQVATWPLYSRNLWVRCKANFRWA